MAIKKQKSSLYECQNCGWQSSKWTGKCPNCGSWESLVELKKEQISYLQNSSFAGVKRGFESIPTRLDSNISLDSVSTDSVLLDSQKSPKMIGNAIAITEIMQESLEKFSSTQSELDIVLGGGIVRGGLYLIGGSPGVGKSTLLLKVAGSLAQGVDSINVIESNLQDSNIIKNRIKDSKNSKYPNDKDSKVIESNFQDSIKNTQNLDSKNPNFLDKNLESKINTESKNITESKTIDSNNFQNIESIKPKRVLYVSGEESLSQIRNRAQRCNALSENLYLLSEINIDEIRENLLNGGFEVCIIDSIQTLYSPALNAAPGSISQVREITFELMRLAKSLNIAIFIIGHITKDGQIAGPRVLEHMVDCVLYFEGEKSSELKILRGFKNRFGTTSEIGIFEMRENGLVSATEATKKFFSGKRDMPGSAAAAIMEGSRCIVVEIQALTCENEFGVPKRLTNGFDSNRLNMILALLEKKMGIHLHRHDVFINVAGGIKISEPSADLAVIASILSSYKNRALKSSTAFLGEVSLIGDIRDISALEMRLKELENFGFAKAIIPGASGASSKFIKSYKGSIKCIPVDEVAKIIEWM